MIKIPGTSGLVTTTVVNTKTSGLVKKQIMTQKLVKIIGETKITDHDHAKYINTQLTAENFKERLKQTNLLNKTDFDNKLISFNRNITSNKTKYLEVKKLNGLTTKEWNSFFGRMYFTSTDGSQNTFLYQPTLDEIELKKKQRH